MSLTSRDFGKVQKAAEKDNFLSNRLSERMIKVYKPTGEVVEFSETVVAIANYLVSQGFDPKTAPAGVIQSSGFSLVNNQVTNGKRFYPEEDEIRPAKSAGSPDSNGASAADSEPKGRGRRKVAGRRGRKPVAESNGEPEPSAPRRGRGRPRHAEVAAPALATPRRGRRAAAAEAKPARRGRGRSSSVVEYSVPMWMGVVSNCVVIRELLQRHDKTPRQAERLAHLDALLASITNEKESGSLQFPVQSPEEAGAQG